MLREAGVGEYDAVALSRRIASTHTGGVDVSTLITAVNPEGSETTSKYL